MFFFYCCKPTPPLRPNYEVSVAVRSKATVRVSSVQPSTPTPTPTSSPPQNSYIHSVASLAHSRFASTDQISLQSVLISSPGTIHSIPEHGKK